MPLYMIISIIFDITIIFLVIIAVIILAILISKDDSDWNQNVTPHSDFYLNENDTLFKEWVNEQKKFKTRDNLENDVNKGE